MKKYYIHFIFAALLFVSCSDDILAPGYEFDSSVDGSTITVRQNQQFTLELELAADGGYQWDHSISDLTVVKIDSTSKRPKNGDWNIIGGMTIEKFYFKGLKRGKCTVNLKECQHWEPDVDPINTVQFDVIVR